jgi:hypothetical protein
VASRSASSSFPFNQPDGTDDTRCASHAERPRNGGGTRANGIRSWPVRAPISAGAPASDGEQWHASTASPSTSTEPCTSRSEPAALCVSGEPPGSSSTTTIRSASCAGCSASTATSRSGNSRTIPTAATPPPPSRGPRVTGSGSWYSPDRQRRYTYGLGATDHAELLRQQQGACAICEGSTAPLTVDHDHRSGRVRALLCNRCNRAIGHLQDSAGVARRAADYLRASTRPPGRVAE